MQIIAKFAAHWFSPHPSAKEFAFITLTMYKQSHAMLNKIVKDEGLDAWKDFGYVNDAQSMYLLKKDKSDFSAILHQVQEVFGKENIIQYSRKNNEAEFVEKVDKQFG